MMTYRSKPTENSVESAILKHMRARGWRATRNHVGVFRPVHGGYPVTIGTPGFPDWTFTRSLTAPVRGTLQLMHVEVKRPGQRPKPKQHEVMASLNHMGELAVWADSLESFQVLYATYFPGEPIK